eukprot:Gb_22967 [translate_table: standard]
MMPKRIPKFDIEIWEHDVAWRCEEFWNFEATHLIMLALEQAQLTLYLPMPPIFYNLVMLVLAISMVFVCPDAHIISKLSIHKITRLLVDRPEVPIVAQQDRQVEPPIYDTSYEFPRLEGWSEKYSKGNITDEDAYSAVEGHSLNAAMVTIKRKFKDSNCQQRGIHILLHFVFIFLLNVKSPTTADMIKASSVLLVIPCSKWGSSKIDRMQNLHKSLEITIGPSYANLESAIVKFFLRQILTAGAPSTSYRASFWVNRMATRALLVCLGCDVAVASSGWDCLQMISQPGQKFKVILLDVCMPAMDGYELAIRIQEKFPFRHERPLLVALTASTDRATKENCLKVGMDGVILKPVSLDKMQYVLAELLQHGFLCDSPRRI